MSPASPQPPAFSRLRFALLVLLGVYPIITAVLYVILPLTDGWPLYHRTLIVAPLMTAIMVWGLIPAIQHRFRAWLHPSRK